MSEHTAVIRWTRPGDPGDFRKGRYSREHTWSFDGGMIVDASPSPSVVPAPWSNPAAVDPEEAFVAAISSCHFLTFAWLVARAGFQLDSYEDHAVGKTAKNERGALWVSEVTLNVVAIYGGDKLPTEEEEDRLHHRAHEECFIANSVKTTVTVARKSATSTA